MDKNSISFTYQCGVYLRLSKEDEDISSSVQKSQSNSIENQKQFIEEYLKNKQNIQITEYYIDDGYSGVNFERPSFQKMLQAIKAGQINCVIVKDLSRFGRNYIEVGKYVEKLFPALGVRFIAINDHYDSADENTASNNIIVPFKNLINDAYCRDISIKIRSHLEIKRKKGEFIGAFTVYGYRKGENKNQLIIDDYAAEIVKEIFRMKMNGMSQQAIADELNSLGILSPAEYKKEQGSGYKAVSQKKAKAVWTAMAVYRILRNEVYTGTMVQGKESTPNYKVKVRERKAPEQWNRVENTHEAIIKKSDFEVVQDIIKKDARVMDGKKDVSVFSGYLLCADCGCSMVRKKVPSGNIFYVYYVCSGNKKDKNCCSNHRISETALYEAVQKTLRLHIENLLDLQEQLDYIETSSFIQKESAMVECQIEKEQENIERYSRLKLGCYEDYKSGLLSREEYLLFQKEMKNRVESGKNTILELKRRKDNFLLMQNKKQKCLKELLLCQNIGAELTRCMIVRFIDCIYIYEEHRIEVIFRYQDEIERLAGLAENSKAVNREVV